MSRFLFFGLLALLSMVQAPEAAKGPHLPDLEVPLRSGARNLTDSAVIIGIEDYLVVQDVPYAARDAESFNSLMVYTRGVPQARIQKLVSVQGSSQASREAIETAVGRAGQETLAGGTVWVFFSGHGVADPANPQDRLLLGDDVRADETSFASRGISITSLRGLATSGGAEVVMVIDACFGGVSRTGDPLLAGKHFVVPAYASSAEGVQGVEWNAASPNELSGPLDAASQGAFSYFSTGALRGWADGELNGQRDQQVTAEEAQAYVSRILKVAGIRTQLPVLVGDSGKVLIQGATEQGPTDEELTSAIGTALAGAARTATGVDIVALAAAEAKARKAAETLRAAKDAEFASQTAALQAEAWREWSAVAPLLAVKDASSQKVIEAFVAKYGSAMAVVGEEQRPIPIAEVALANAWLASLDDTAADSERLVVEVRSVEYPMVRIHAGTFSMGSPSTELGRAPDEILHKVRITRDFWLGETEVTQAFYQTVMGRNPSYFTTCGSTCAVESVSWCDAILFANELSRIEELVPAYRLPTGFTKGMDAATCNARAANVNWDRSADGYRLPTEAEWEYAAEAGENKLYAGSDDLEAVTWHNGNSTLIHPVRQKQPNGWGLYDMSGNAWEWVWDGYNKYTVGTVTDPMGTPTSTTHVGRGGSWYDAAVFARVSARGGGSPSTAWRNRGLRLAR